VYTWNQKLTVTLQTPDGPISASSVSRVTKTRTNAFWVPIEARGVRSSLQGEAVVLEVKPGSFLFVLLDGVDQLAFRAFPQIELSQADDIADWASAIENHQDVGEVPADFYPMIVTFEDFTDPTTVGLVKPNSMSAIFGEGYELEGMNLTITQDPTTVGAVEKVLSWWPTSRSGPRNEMSPLQLPNDSPRGWQNLGPNYFWSLDRRQVFNEVSE